ncbi:hypothetical protein B9J09_10455 [Xylella fastidiosa subsp. pauca]|nr:hypothetical protein B9J09_10455 [Xylella fastidiosa subsp. pauca]TNW27064.1 hypothetical protein EIP74_08035 [Xylella fastidiosa subsp. pauca]
MECYLSEGYVEPTFAAWMQCRLSRASPVVHALYPSLQRVCVSVVSAAGGAHCYFYVLVLLI